MKRDIYLALGTPWTQLELDQDIPTMYDVVLAVMFYVLGGPCQCRSTSGRVCRDGWVGSDRVRSGVAMDR